MPIKIPHFKWGILGLLGGFMGAGIDLLSQKTKKTRKDWGGQ